MHRPLHLILMHGSLHFIGMQGSFRSTWILWRWRICASPFCTSPRCMLLCISLGELFFALHLDALFIALQFLHITWMQLYLHFISMHGPLHFILVHCSLHLILMQGPLHVIRMQCLHPYALYDGFTNEQSDNSTDERSTARRGRRVSFFSR